MIEAQSRIYLRWVSAQIERVVIIWLSQVILFQLSVSVAPVYMNARISWHEGDGLIEDGHCFMVAAFLEQACSHIVVCKADLDGYIVL